jgi:hypothetical protein
MKKARPLGTRQNPSKDFAIFFEENCPEFLKGDIILPVPIAESGRT